MVKIGILLASKKSQGGSCVLCFKLRSDCDRHLSLSLSYPSNGSRTCALIRLEIDCCLFIMTIFLSARCDDCSRSWSSSGQSDCSVPDHEARTDDHHSISVMSLVRTLCMCVRVPLFFLCKVKC